MQSILSQSIPLKDVINDLAKELNTPVTQNCSEYSLQIPEIYGEGSITGIDFEHGMGIILYNCTFTKDMEIRFVVDTIHPLKFLFCETGSFVHHFENDKTDLHYADILENIIVASNQNNGHILQFRGGQKTVINSLEVNRKEYLFTMECEVKSLKKQMENLFRDETAQTAFYHRGDYCIKMADIFSDMKNFKEGPFLQKLFLESSAFKILILQILQFEDDLKEDKNKSILRRSEIKMIQKASSLIDDGVSDFDTVKNLAQEVGLNANKLQNGFKSIYGSTVNGYVHNKRLEIANQLLKNSDYSISEIVFMVGLSSKSYFSKIYKDKYGLSPSILRNSNGKKK